MHICEILTCLDMGVKIFIIKLTMRIFYIFEMVIYQEWSNLITKFINLLKESENRKPQMKLLNRLKMARL